MEKKNHIKDFLKGKRIWMGLFLSIAVIVIFLYSVGIERAVSVMHSISLKGAAFITFLSLLYLFVKAKCTQLALNSMKIKISFLQSFRVSNALIFTNSVTPMSNIGGEPIMAIFLSKLMKMPYEKGFAGILFANLMASVPYYSLTFMSFVLFSIFYDLTSFLQKTLIFISVLFFALFLIIFLVGKNRPFIERIALYLTRKFQKILLKLKIKEAFKFSEKTIEKKIKSFYNSFSHASRNRKNFTALIFLSHLSSLIHSACLYFILLFIGHAIPIYIAVLVYTISTIFSLSPLPGGSGTMEAILIFLLHVFVGIPIYAAFATTLIYRIFTFWLYIIIGGISLSLLK